MRRLLLSFTLVLTGLSAFAQNASIDNETAEPSRKKPLGFTHQPFLLLKVTPTALFESDNVFQFGAEIAPPFGKFSFNFDYGIGKGKNSFNKFVKNNLADTETKVIRGEIRAYFSDWFPFYALDKKPFGRYYALEYMNKNITRTQPVGVSNDGSNFPGFVEIAEVPVQIKEQAIHVKIGKHFLVNRFFFIDGFVGIGPGLYKVENTGTEITNEEILHNGFSLKRKNWQVGSKGLFLSRTAGIRLCLAI